MLYMDIDLVHQELLISENQYAHHVVVISDDSPMHDHTRDIVT